MTKPQAWPLRMAAAGTATLLLLQAGGEPLRQALRYDRQAVLQGELWRLFTAHLVHLGWTHCLLNVAGLLLCCALAPKLFQPRRAALELPLLAAAVSLLLLLLSPQVGNYVGLSGMLYGMFVLGLAPQAARGDRFSAAALLFVLGWMAWQLAAGTSPDEERLIGGHIVAQAHGYGVLAAAGLLGLRWVWGAWRRGR